ncbi:hypothetical protein KIH27_02170 [Mycobacterium sp. M1]|uniref:Uncharacterized protein n=1 Tax=Mycolicibacter acidiphilus TaxID=2835306 RepID=A0ABS5RDN1_9MYCO|nr:hypothetical protein [Mycolicibacter acidiphilus]MBS9532391.1 hypothetical protein [Mycolicibacter acidiphilus]
MSPDDPTIGCEETLHRYSPSIPHAQWTVTDQGTQEVMIAVAAVRFDADGISCYRNRILLEHGLSWLDVKREPRNGIFSILVGDVRDVGLGVAFDPYPETEQPHPRDVAHSLIVDNGLPKKEGRVARETLAKRAKIIHTGTTA